MRRNIRVYYLYAALQQAHIWIFFVVWVVFLREMRGLSLAQIGVIDAAFWISMVLCEVPTGVVADRVGRKVSLLIGIGLEIVGLIVFVLANQFAALIGANIILGAAFTFHSGAAQAFLYESLKAIGREKSYSAVFGRADAIGRIITVIAGLAGGLVASVSLIYPYVAGLCLAAIETVVILLMHEPPHKPDASDTEKPTITMVIASYRRILSDAVRLLQEDRNTRPLLLYLALTSAVSYMIFLFIQPLVIHLGFSTSAVAIAVVIINVGGIAGSALAGSISTDGLGRLVLLLSPLVVAASLLFIGGLATPLVLIPGVVVVLLFSLVQPILGAMLNKRLPDAVRATVFSFQSVLTTAVLAIIVPIAGRLADVYGSPSAFVLIAGLVICYCVYHLRMFGRVIQVDASVR